MATPLRISRAERSLVGEWWFTVDWGLLAALFLLTTAGVILSVAASPAVALHLGLEPYFFVHRHLVFLVPAMGILFTVSLLSPRQMLSLAGLVLVLAFLAMMVLPWLGAGAKGAQRWLVLGNLTLQPSEFAKPVFVLLSAWLFARGIETGRPLAPLAALGLFALFVALLVRQPDYGQAVLVTLVWGSLAFLAGRSVLWLGGLVLASGGGLFLAYLTQPHVARRIDAFLFPDSTDRYQLERALQSFVSGGWFGRGPGEGALKQTLPDAHTDFIFAVAAEEFGLLACLLLVALFAFIVLRGLRHAAQETEPFHRLAVAGLFLLFGFQALINMAVNLDLIPAKGITLPFVSYGGSSLLSVALTMGLALGLSRRRAGRGWYGRHGADMPMGSGSDRREGEGGARP